MKKMIIYILASIAFISISLLGINIIFRDDNPTEIIEPILEMEDEVVEKPIEVSFDDENLKYIADVIYYSSNLLLDADNGELNQDNLDVSKKEYIALSQCDSKEDLIFVPAENQKYKDLAWYIKKEKIDEQMIRIFGNDNYEPVDFQFFNLVAKYDDENNVFWTLGDGGGPNSYPVIGIYKVDKYSDRYEVFIKYLYVENMQYQGSYGFIFKITSGGNSKKLLDYYKTEGIGAVSESLTEFKTIKELCGDVSIITFVKNDRMISNNLSERDMLLSKYYDDATEYKVTFLISNNGAINWQKTELVK